MPLVGDNAKRKNNSEVLLHKLKYLNIKYFINLISVFNINHDMFNQKLHKLY